MGLILALALLSIALIMVGIIVKGLLWLMIVGIVLLVADFAYVAISGRTS
jgi:hypothetical protein